MIVETIFNAVFWLNCLLQKIAYIPNQAMHNNNMIKNWLQ